MRVVGVLLLIAIFFVIVPLPTWVAKFRSHPNLREISYLNVILVWTGIGWVILLLWAASGRESEKVRSIRQRFRR